MDTAEHRKVEVMDQTFVRMVNAARMEEQEALKAFDITKDRQDQLQAMVGARPIDELWTDFSTWVEVCAICGEGDWRLRQYKTFDQLWLAFVMHEKFGKRWNGTEWKKEQS